MKKLYLSLAAIVAALSSCVEENNIVPVQNDNKLTINAVAGNTKTVLNGTSVLWENNDAVKVVFKKSDTEKPDTYYMSEFTTSVADGSTAAFTGTLDAEVTVDACGETGFAVYPSSVEVESDGQIEFEVSNVQNGVVGGGNNLSYAEVSLAELRGQKKTTTTFHNALSLIKVTVPDGVKKVTLASKETSVNIAGEDEEENWVLYKAPLTGTATFYYTDGALAINPDKWGDSEMVSVPGTDEFESVTIKYYSVVLEAEGNTVLDNTKTYDVLVFPGLHKGLTVTVEGDDCTYSKDIETEFDFVASKYYTLDLENIFSLETNEFFVSPLGGDVDVPVVTTLDAYEVNIPDDAKDWLSVKPAVKSVFREDVVTLTAKENTASERSATVTITSGDNTLAQFTVTQKNYVKELIGEYLESYSHYGESKKGTFKVVLSDDFSKGMYKVTVCGKDFYADYEAGKLNFYDGKNTKTLTVAEDFSRFEAANLEVNYTSYTDYVAFRSLGPAVLSDDEQALVGKYNETYNVGEATITSVQGLTITASEEAAYGRLLVRCLTQGGSYYESYTSLEESTLSVKVPAYTSHNYFGTLYYEKVLIFTVNSDKTLTLETQYVGNKEISNYVAVPFGEGEEGGDEGDDEGGDEPDGDEPSGDVVTPEDLMGTYSETFTTFMGPSTGTMTITVSGSDITVAMLNGGCNCSAILNDDGKTLTVKSDGIGYNGNSNDPFSGDLILTVGEVEGTVTLKLSSSMNLWGMTFLNSYTATMN